MKIREIRAAAVRNATPLGRSDAPIPSWLTSADTVNPLSRYREFMGQGLRFHPPWQDLICIATAEDGTWGMSMSTHAGPVVPIINDYLAPLLAGESALATERVWNMMVRCSGAMIGASGPASYAVSAVDLALWDLTGCGKTPPVAGHAPFRATLRCETLLGLAPAAVPRLDWSENPRTGLGPEFFRNLLKGKLFGRPVYELIGGPARDRIHCYATGNDVEHQLELGFDAIKLVCEWGAAEGNRAIRETETLVAGARERLGNDGALMIDLWPVQDAQHTVELGNALRPYRLKWLEDPVFPEDWGSYREVRQRLPWQTLAAGERWYTDRAFQHAAEDRIVDIFQPDVVWAGGVTGAMKIAAIAESAGLEIAMHTGCNDAYGQHLCHALPGNRWGEFAVTAGRGASLMDNYRATPGMALPIDGHVVPSDAPGFGIEMTLQAIEAAT